MPNHTRLTFFQQRALRVYNHTETVRFLNNSKLAKNIKTTAHCDIESQNEIFIRETWRGESISECDWMIFIVYSSADSFSTVNGLSTGSDPQSAITTSFTGLSPPAVFVLSIFRTTLWRRTEKYALIYDWARNSW